MVDREKRLTAEASEEALEVRRTTARPQVHKGHAHKPKRHARAPGDDARDDLPPDEREADDVLESLSDEERAALFFGALSQSALPDLPEIPGYHTCWLTTTHQSDTLAKRRRLGYTLIHADELGAEWRSMGVGSGEHAGCVMCNEMIAAKIPRRLFNYLMQQAHHFAPLAEEEKIRAAIDQAKDALEDRGSYLQEGDAMPGLVKRAPAPTFVR